MSQLQTKINQAMINVTVPTLLENAGIAANPVMIDHLKKNSLSLSKRSAPNIVLINLKLPGRRV